MYDIKEDCYISFEKLYDLEKIVFDIGNLK